MEVPSKYSCSYSQNLGTCLKWVETHAPMIFRHIYVHTCAHSCIYTHKFSMNTEIKYYRDRARNLTSWLARLASEPLVICRCHAHLVVLISDPAGVTCLCAKFGCWDLNAELHVCSGSPSPTESSPWPHSIIRHYFIGNQLVVIHS